MGILDALTGMTPEQNSGLLGFGAQLLSSSSNPYRPTDFGSAIQAGQQSALQAEQLKREREQAAMQARLLGLKVQDAESDVKNQEALRQRAESLRQFYMQRGMGGAQGSSAMGMGSPSPVEGGMAPAGTPATGGGGGGNGLYQQRLAEAQALRAQGFGQEADAAEAAALKFQPKVSGWKEVQQSGKVMYAPFFEDGSSGQPVPLEVAKELEKVNTGGSTELVNSFTGATVRSLKNTADPNSVLQANVSMRGQNMIDARAREANQISKAPPGYRFTPDGSLQVIAGGPADVRSNKEGVQKVQDARDVLSILDEAEPLLSKSTSSYLGAGRDQVARVFGSSTEGGEAAAQLKVLQGQLVAKQPKMSGPQSDKDVQLYREMAGQIGDPTLPESSRRAAAQTIRKLSEKYLNDQGDAPAKSKAAGWSIKKVGQ